MAVNSSFNPLNFTNSNGESIIISAQQSPANTTFASVEATSNPVNTSEAGRYYNVTITATGYTGKKTTATYTVLITSSHKQTLYANGASSIPTYNFYGNNPLSGSTTFKMVIKFTLLIKLRLIIKNLIHRFQPSLSQMLTQATFG